MSAEGLGKDLRDSWYMMSMSKSTDDGLGLREFVQCPREAPARNIAWHLWVIIVCSRVVSGTYYFAEERSLGYSTAIFR